MPTWNRTSRPRRQSQQRNTHKQVRARRRPRAASRHQRGIIVVCSAHRRRGGRPRRDRAADEDPRRRASSEHAAAGRALGPDHAVAGRDGRAWPRRSSGAGWRSRCLIGGATTSKRRTAVRIAPEVQPRDGARARRRRAWSASSPTCSIRPADQPRSRQPRRRGATARADEERAGKPLLPLAEARANREAVPFDQLARTTGHGQQAVFALAEELGRLVDWQFLFYAWELKGKFPAILEPPEARELSTTHRISSRRSWQQSLLTARGVYGSRREEHDRRHRARERTMFPCCGRGGRSATRGRTLARGLGRSRWRHIGAFAVADLRRRRARRALRSRARRTRRSWPRRSPTGSPRRRRVAARASPSRVVGAGRAARQRGPDHRALHGIRPAFGCPACPDHALKEPLFELLDARARGST